jgi:dienelactone hydrolase
MQADGRLQQAVCLHYRLIYEDGSIKSTNMNFYEGAGHAFLQRQNEREGANRNATIKAWPRAIRFLKQHLGE